MNIPPVPPDMPEIPGNPGIPPIPVAVPPSVPAPPIPAAAPPVQPVAPPLPPVPPMGYPPVAIPKPGGMGSGTKALLFGCLGLALVAVVFLIAGGVWVAKKGKEVLENPGQFLAEMVVRQNPDLEIVGVDNAAKKVVFRSKKSGEQATFAFDDLKGGRISIEKSDGSKAELDTLGIKVTDKEGKETTITPPAGEEAPVEDPPAEEPEPEK